MDTSAWYAAADSSDRSNARVKQALGSVDSLVSTDHVLVETWTLLRHKLGRGAADNFWFGLLSGIASVEPVGLADIQVAWESGQAFPDQDFSIVDRTSFAVMQRLGIASAVTLDADFSVFRYGRNRDRAFTVLP